MIFRLMIFRLVRPYLQEMLAKLAADYLQKRRERRLQVRNDDIAPTVTPLAEQAQEITSPLVSPSVPSRSATANAIWFTLSGILLGSAIGVILAQILREE
jgi:hypothetical protein